MKCYLLVSFFSLYGSHNKLLDECETEEKEVAQEEINTAYYTHSQINHATESERPTTIGFYRI